MKLTAITFSRSGTELARKLKGELGELDIYLKDNFVNEKKEYPIEKPFGRFVGRLFDKYQGLIFIMATGIVVRKIAPYLKSKKEDPAVVVIDDLGQHVISLLSGHLGGANRLTKEIATLLDGTCVITTSTDLHQVSAFDLLADRNDMKVERANNLKYISGALIDGKSLGLFSDYPIKADLSSGVELKGTLHDFAALKNKEIESYKERWSGLVLITHRLIDERLVEKWGLPLIVLRPSDLVIGIGFRRGKTCQELKKAFYQACLRARVSPASIDKIATIDHKQDEPGLHQLEGNLELTVEILSKESIKQVDDQFERSELVIKVLGVGGVAEPSAFLASGRGEMILKKTRLDGITAAIFKKNNIIVE